MENNEAVVTRPTETTGEIDVSLIEHTLCLSHEERIEAHEAARQLVNDLQEAGREYRAKQPQTAA